MGNFEEYENHDGNKNKGCEGKTNWKKGIDKFNRKCMRNNSKKHGRIRKA